MADNGDAGDAIVAGQDELAKQLAQIVATSVEDMQTRWTQWADSKVGDAEIANYRALVSKAAAQLQAANVKVDVNAKDERSAAELEEMLKGIDPSEWEVPPHCVPIHANVVTYDWSNLYNHTKFDVIMMDPPWQLATANPTRGVALGYSQLTDKHIQSLPVGKLQEKGLLFVWVINAKYKFAIDLFKRWGYKLVDEIVWVKLTVNRRMAKSHGYYLQHAKEVCLVGQKGGGVEYNRNLGQRKDVIVSERRGQSQKPEEIYHMIEDLVPNGKYLEIFARKNNLHNYWVSVGNEITGTGLPAEDAEAVRNNQRIPGAVFGAAARGSS